MEFLSAVSLLLVLLNPFALSVYLIDIFHAHATKLIASVIARAALIALFAFSLFAWGGELIITRGLNVRFASFQIFGGLVFLAVGMRMMLSGSRAIEGLRGSPEHIAGSIAMPFMIGPATVSASAWIGTQLGVLVGIATIATALLATVATLVVLKVGLDRVKQVNARLVERYVEIAGRLAAVVAGTVAVDMIISGIESWLDTL